MLNTIWNKKEYDSSVVDDLEEIGLNPLVSKVLAGRGLTDESSVKEFFNLSLTKLHDPFLLPNINVALDRIIKAIEANEKIYVWGDYDVDGITATATVVTVLRKLNANFDYHVPHRQLDGYDIKEESINKAHKEGATLIITVDCGILAFAAAERAKKLNIGLIITDHHTPSDDGLLPDCLAVINPKISDEYPFKGLAGVGIAFKVMVALAHRMNYPAKKIIKDTIEYVALGTVADIAPMIDENRILVYHGCKNLNNSEKPGISALLKVSRVANIDSTNIGFTLGPRINAVGRLADPRTALDLLICEDIIDAEILAHELEQSNLQRQILQGKAFKDAVAELELTCDPKQDQCIVIASKAWPAGVVGLIAGKLADTYNVPSLVAHIKEDGFAKGSCRSARRINILECLKSENCIKYFKEKGTQRVVGGHAFAEEFEIPEENVNDLRKALSKEIKTRQPNLEEDNKILQYDAVIKSYELNNKTINDIRRISPFGEQNPIPIFLLRKAKVGECTQISEGKHLKFNVSLETEGFSSNYLNVLWWQHGDLYDEFAGKEYIDVLFNFDFAADKNGFFSRTLSLFALDIKVSK